MSFSRSAWLKGLEDDDESDDEILDEEVGRFDCITRHCMLIVHSSRITYIPLLFCGRCGIVQTPSCT